MTVTPQKRAEDLAKILHTWRASKEVPVCPACGATGLEIKDLSARPHTEWYQFTCMECGLNETLALSQSSSGQRGIN